jgi:PAS domain S-box-containing protein
MDQRQISTRLQFMQSRLDYLSQTVAGYPAASPDELQSVCDDLATIVSEVNHLSLGLEAALKEEEERYRRLIDAAPLLITVVVDGRIVFVNPAGVQMLRAETPRDVLYRPVSDLIPSIDWERSNRRIFQVVAERQEAPPLEIKLLRVDGTMLDVISMGVPITYQGNPAIQIIAIDVTERKRIENALLESRERLQLAAEAGEIGAWRMDPRDYIIEMDERCADHFGFPFNTSIAYPTFLEALHPADRARTDQVLQQAIAEQGAYEIEYRVMHRDRNVRWVMNRGHSLVDDTGHLQAILGVTLDITHSIEDEEERRKVMARLEVQRRLIDQREEDRQQIARDLHDGPIQELVGATFAIQEAIHGTTDENQLGKLSAIQGSVQATISSLREFCSEMRPPTLMNFGLDTAIRSHLDGFQEKYPEITFDFSARSVGDPLNPGLRVTLFRIYQELVTNIIHHAGASQVKISLSKKRKSVQLLVRDNGSGFNLPAEWLDLARQGHLGLVGLRERAEAVGGTVDIDSVPGRGTRAKVTIPIR